MIRSEDILNRLNVQHRIRYKLIKVLHCFRSRHSRVVSVIVCSTFQGFPVKAHLKYFAELRRQRWSFKKEFFVLIFFRNVRNFKDFPCFTFCSFFFFLAEAESLKLDCRLLCHTFQRQLYAITFSSIETSKDSVLIDFKQRL